MSETQFQDNTTAAVEAPDQIRQVWVAPKFQRVPLNEAEASFSGTASQDATYHLS